MNFSHIITFISSYINNIYESSLVERGISYLVSVQNIKKYLFVSIISCGCMEYFRTIHIKMKNQDL